MLAASIIVCAPNMHHLIQNPSENCTYVNDCWEQSNLILIKQVQVL
jgi:hypothetical protein